MITTAEELIIELEKLPKGSLVQLNSERAPGNVKISSWYTYCTSLER